MLRQAAAGQRISGRRPPQIAATAKLAILVFNGKCTQKAMRVLDKEGPQAIFNKIDVHHLHGFITGDTSEETEQNIAENCN